MSRFALVYAVAFRIPRGRVATYGQVARLASLPGQARLVGYALAALDDRSRVPWHRVVNAKGRVSLRGGGSDMGVVQRLRLEREGIRFGPRGCIDLSRFRWRPRAAGNSLGPRARDSERIAVRSPGSPRRGRRKELPC